MKNMKTTFIFICFLIIYGSLFPFNFDGSKFTYDTFYHLTTTLTASYSIGDVFGNILLFIPFGFIGMLFFIRRKKHLTSLSFLIISGLALAFICQVAQISLPSRSPVLSDVIWNLVGLFIGLTVSYSTYLRALFNSNNISHISLFPLLLICLYLFSQLVPFVPTIDLQAYKNALKPLLTEPNFNWHKILLSTASWLAFAYLAKQAIKPHWKGIYLPLIMLMVVLAQIIIVTRSLSVNDIAGTTIALLLWGLYLHQSSNRAIIIASLLLLAIIIKGLAPFEFSYIEKNFSWLPLNGFLTNSMLINLTSFVDKLFLFGAVLWLAREAKWQAIPTTIIMTMAILFIEIAQIWLTSHSPEVTDPLLVVFMGGVWLRYKAKIIKSAGIEN